jgi:acetate kinase
MMATRSGDVDPGALLYASKMLGKTPDEMTEWLNNSCGLLGVGGSADMRDIISGDLAGDPAKKLAFAMFTHRIKKYIGAYFFCLRSAIILS